MCHDFKLIFYDRECEPIALKSMAKVVLWATSRRESAATMALGRYSIAGIGQFKRLCVLMVRLGRVGWIADVWRALNNGCKSKRFWPLQAQSHDTSIPAVLNMYLIPTYISTSLSTIKSLGWVGVQQQVRLA